MPRESEQGNQPGISIRLVLHSSEVGLEELNKLTQAIGLCCTSVGLKTSLIEYEERRKQTPGKMLRSVTAEWFASTHD